MTIREYFDRKYHAANDFETWDAWEEVAAEEMSVYAAYEEDYDSFLEWAESYDINLEAKDASGEFIVVCWAWDMCGD